MENTLLPKNSQVIANSTVIGKISTGKGDVCSGGTHLDLKIYNYANKHYYNPSVFTYGIINGLTDIPVSSYIRGYRGKKGASGYDSMCNYKC